ncbi:hypothetical protein BVC80_441g21 [Macleaya cordata]|uniref:Uncharacterized protein n=1 Tax=Macleaya cordata TaxID=56857 RepID=A0A200Q4A9_MACCD|nr:hypothetical protein BVC80_441g21 [Macleaya cordata]
MADCQALDGGLVDCLALLRRICNAVGPLTLCFEIFERLLDLYPATVATLVSFSNPSS